jgi:hypothetical protein
MPEECYDGCRYSGPWGSWVSHGRPHAAKEDLAMNPVVYLLPLVCVPILIGLAWMAKSPLPQEISADPGEKIEDLFPLHTQHFPQLKQSLASTDEGYLRPKLSKDRERLWREERAKILESFLDGLAGDFGRVMRLGRLVDSLSSNAAKPDGIERFWLALRFRLQYRILSLWISGGGAVEIGQLRGLTESVGSLAAMVEADMPQLETGDDETEMPQDFNA